MARITRWTVAVTVVVAAGMGLALPACGKPATEDQAAEVLVATRPARDDAAATIARASSATSSVASGRLRMTYSMSGSGQGERFAMTMSGDGAFADFGRKAELAVQVSGVPGGGLGGGATSLSMREIVDGTTVYVTVDAAEPIPGLPSGWNRLDLSDVPGASSGGLGGIGAGWSGFLDSLKGAGSSVVERGPDTLDGVPVTVYEGTVDPQAAMDEAAPEDVTDLQAALDQMGGSMSMPFTAWVDADGMVRRLEMRVTADMFGAQLDMTMTLELYDFGAPVTIEVPPADQVNDLGDPGVSGLLGPQLGTA